MRRRFEIGDLLKDAVFVNLEVFLLQVRNPFSVGVFDADGEIDQFSLYLDLSFILRVARAEQTDHPERQKTNGHRRRGAVKLTKFSHGAYLFRKSFVVPPLGG